MNYTRIEERKMVENALAQARIDAEAHDAWFRAKVQQALEDPRPGTLNDEVEFPYAKRRAVAQGRVIEVRDCDGYARQPHNDAHRWEAEGVWPAD
jgi:hypothetical protein